MFSCSFFISFADTGTPIMEGSFNNTTALPPPEDCQPLTAREEELYQELASRISWWFEGLLQCCVGSIGFLANVTFPPSLLSIQNFSSKSAAEAAKELHKAASRLSVKALRYKLQRCTHCSLLWDFWDVIRLGQAIFLRWKYSKGHFYGLHGHVLST